MWHLSRNGSESRGALKPKQARERFRDIATESEMFLNGRYAERLIDQGRKVPDWAWLNLIAHSSPETIERIAVSVPAVGRWRGHRADDAELEELLTWQRTVQYLAGELVRRAHSNSTAIRDLQSPGLVELELELARKGEAAGCAEKGLLSPAQLAVVVLSQLDNPITHSQ